MSFFKKKFSKILAKLNFSLLWQSSVHLASCGWLQLHHQWNCIQFVME